MLKLSAFADEISPDLNEQIRVCKELGITHVELRGVNRINVLDFDAILRQEIKTKLDDSEMGVICIGSPIGKVKITDSWAEHFERFKIAVEAAEFFEAPYIRLFSYYPPEKEGDIRRHRDEVMKRMAAKVEYVRNHHVTLLHENEVDIYGARGPECLDLMKTINSPKLRCAFDFANFVQTADHPLDSWQLLKPYTAHIHVKDAVWGSGMVVPAGQGDGQVEPILIDAWNSGYRGFLSLEPHLAAHEQFSGFSGPGLFKVGADALRALCKKNGIELANG